MIVRGARNFADLTEYEIRGAELLTIDVENVLTPFGQPEVQPEAIDRLEYLSDLAYLAIATNNKNEEFIDCIARQLSSEIPIYSAIEYRNPKTSGAMFTAVANDFGINPDKCMHIDDQALSLFGARLARFGYGTVVKANSRTDHPGVKIGRFIDEPVRRLLIVAQGAVELTLKELDY